MERTKKVLDLSPVVAIHHAKNRLIQAFPKNILSCVSPKAHKPLLLQSYSEMSRSQIQHYGLLEWTLHRLFLCPKPDFQRVKGNTMSLYYSGRQDHGQQGTHVVTTSTLPLVSQAGWAPCESKRPVAGDLSWQRAIAPRRSRKTSQNAEISKVQQAKFRNSAEFTTCLEASCC